MKRAKKTSAILALTMLTAFPWTSSTAAGTNSLTDQAVTSESTARKTKSGLNMKIESSTDSIAPGGKVKLTLLIDSKDAGESCAAPVKWSSSNPRYATVSKDGVVTAKKAGQGKRVTITASIVGSSEVAQYEFSITRGGVKKISLSGSRSARAGQSLQLRASVTAVKGANKRLYWYTSNTRYATVSQRGLVRTKRAGKGRAVTITARATDGSGKRASIAIRLR